MQEREIDPANLADEDLVRWYSRSPNEVESERAGRKSHYYQNYFGSKYSEIFELPARSIDRSLASVSDGAQLIEIGNPENVKLKRQYIRVYGYWPKTDDGRDYDVAHIKAIADGGTNTLENIRPMHPDAHAAEHIANGDPGRWGRRASIARAFGGRVAKALGPLSIIPDITGVLSGRIRTDNFDNFTSDIMGWPSCRFQEGCSHAAMA